MKIEIEIKDERSGKAFLQWLNSWVSVQGNILNADLTDVSSIMVQNDLRVEDITLYEPSLVIYSVKEVRDEYPN